MRSTRNNKIEVDNYRFPLFIMILIIRRAGSSLEFLTAGFETAFALHHPPKVLITI
jgi:hypothetical protein